uniref:Reverse transcriptase domain-containing protein n=1 Tax=Chromera velia CCMP2878 TaxID=1169474 RepID=A0A0G4I8W5_9ALVE|eukprot:Cvel_11999.t1-p1 / transcript=Cvel_11999.t1 / gene=Cvel_11999 / organism=Chromera_velia_CCMP2878 / gene_product=hypothetical protein / transcript_product=hypothetical protein / location=Cvel_scaffold770:17074-19436(-) / protein_length=522 / sequence_SO=supercontig / SO=protein_coding / is_pseudo=false
MLYINDLPTFVKEQRDERRGDPPGKPLMVGNWGGHVEVEILLYADDLVIVRKKQQRVQWLLEGLERYCEEKGLMVNMLKTYSAFFGSVWNTEASRQSLKYRRKEITRVEAFRYLGTVFAKDGSVRHGIEAKIKRVRGKIHAALGQLAGGTMPAPAVTVQICRVLTESIFLHDLETVVVGEAELKAFDDIRIWLCRKVLRAPNFSSRAHTLTKFGFRPAKFLLARRSLRYVYQLMSREKDNLCSLVMQERVHAYKVSLLSPQEQGGFIAHVADMAQLAGMEIGAVLDPFFRRPACIERAAGRWAEKVDAGLAKSLKESLTRAEDWGADESRNGQRGQAGAPINSPPQRTKELSVIYAADSSDIRQTKLLWKFERDNSFATPRPQRYLLEQGICFAHRKAVFYWRVGACSTPYRSARRRGAERLDPGARCREAECARGGQAPPPADELHLLTACAKTGERRRQIEKLGRDTPKASAFPFGVMEWDERVYVKTLGPLLRFRIEEMVRKLYGMYKELDAARRRGEF